MNNDRSIIFTISYSTSTKSYTIATTDERVSCIDKITNNLLSAEIMETMCNITGVLNNRGYSVLFEVNWYEYGVPNARALQEGYTYG